MLGRTHWLLDAGKALADAGHEIVLVATAAAAPEYFADAHDFEVAAASWSATFANGIDINSDAGIELLESCAADVAVSVNWPSLIKAGAIAACGRGIMNGHLGDLPKYRGNACPNWAIINGEDRIGLAIHFMDADEVDAGPVLYRRYMDIDESTYIMDVYEWLDSVNAATWCAAVDNLLDPQFDPQPQDVDGIRALRCHPRRPSDGLIDWEMSATDICRLVRASSRPFDGAFSYIEGKKKITIWRASPVELTYDILAVPGQVMSSPQGGAMVSCGEGVLRLEEVEVAGDEALPASNRIRLTAPSVEN